MVTMNRNVMLVAFIFGLPTSPAQSFSKCMDVLVKSFENDMEKCSALQVFTKCLFRYFNVLRKADVSSPYFIATLQARFDQELSQKGIRCEVNVRSIIDQLIKEDKNGVTQVTKQPMGYDHAISVGDCMDTLIEEISPLCSSMVSYLKCHLRVMNGHHINTEHYPAIKDIQKSFSEAGLSCDMDVASLFDDQDGGNGSGLGVQPLKAFVMFLVIIISVFGLH